MLENKYLAKLILSLSVLFLSYSFNSAQVINDPLQGSTVGTQVGGSFTSEGYKPGAGTNHILYSVSSQISNGYIEFEMKGFTPAGIPGENNDHAFITMYDGRGIGDTPSWAAFRDNYFRWNFHWRQNASYFKCVVNCAAPTSARLNSTYAVFIEDMDGDGDVDIDDRDWYDEPGGSSWTWNSSTWYKVKIEWNNKTFKVYVDGQTVWENHKAGLYDYAPKDFKIWLGSGVSKYDADNPNVVYRNFKLFNSGGSSNYLSVTPSSQNVSSAAGSTTFSVSSNVSWTVSDDASWLTVSPTSGSNDGTLTANYDENTTTSSRTGTITVTGGGITSTVTVVQEGQTTSNYLTVTPSSQNVSSTAGTTTFSISSDVDWTASDDASWLSVSPTSGTGDATLTATYDENTTTSSRTATITVTGGGITRNVTVVQEGQTAAPFLNVTPSNHDVTTSSGSVTFNIESNVTWEVRDDSDWLSKTPKNGSGNATLTANYEANSFADSRISTITITGGGFTRTVTVTQEGATAYLNVSPATQNVADTAGSTSFSISSNVTWSITDDSDWLTLSSSNGIGDSTFSATFTKNSSSDSRTAIITVTGNGITKTVNVVQAGLQFTPTLIITPSNIEVTSDSGSATFNIESNTNWTVTDNADWLTKSPKDSSGNATLTVTYQANTDTLVRVAILTISGNGITKTATVTQLGAKLFNITAESNPSNAANIIGHGPYTENSTVTLTCIPNSGWKFDRWTENGIVVSTDSIHTFTVDSSSHFVAELSNLTGIEKFTEGTPKEYSLFNNYPNPFNPSTIIRFALPAGEVVNLSVYNLLGEMVAQLVNEYRTEGYHSVEFNAVDLPSGTYLYQLKTANYSETKKLILLK